MSLPLLSQLEALRGRSRRRRCQHRMTRVHFLPQEVYHSVGVVVRVLDGLLALLDDGVGRPRRHVTLPSLLDLHLEAGVDEADVLLLRGSAAVPPLSLDFGMRRRGLPSASVGAVLQQVGDTIPNFWKTTDSI